MNAIRLPGCRPEPLLAYLKALGLFRLVAEQADQAARATWDDDVLVLHTRLSEAKLISYLLKDYRPSPIVVPWSSAFFVEAASQKRPGVKGESKYTAAPTEAKGLAAYLATDDDRLRLYRETIQACYQTLRDIGVLTKTEVSKRKAELLTVLRSRLPDEAVPWLDVAFALGSGADKPVFNTLLGSGGGSDGRANFADNFMQNLWDVLPEFDGQRKSRSATLDRQGLLQSALLGTPEPGLLAGRTSALFDSGAVGGANATQGMERGAQTNPWSFILGLEGALCLAGAVSRRLNASRTSAAFPFTVRSRAVGSGTFGAARESGQWEVWLPLWERPMSLAEIKTLFAEGRADVRRKAARDGVDFARAVASYGVDRGLTAFARYAIVKGRIGGENYNTAAALGRFVVAPQAGADLLLEIDRWLDQVRRVCDSGDAPARFRVLMRRLDEAIVAYCRFGDKTRFTTLLGALGQMERALSRTGKKPGWVGTSKVAVPPVPPLSARWMQAADDGSVEFRLAAALASIEGIADRLGPLRCHLEPVASERAEWDLNARGVAWGAGGLAHNLAAVLERRLIEAERANVEHPPFASKRAARPADVCAFLAGDVDDRRMEDLLWGLSLIHWKRIRTYRPTVTRSSLAQLPRAYALIKLLFLPESDALQTDNGQALWPDASILTTLRAGDIRQAVRHAARRLRSSGHRPLVEDAAWSTALTPTRLAAALVIPLALPASRPAPSENGLAQLVCRSHKPVD